MSKEKILEIMEYLHKEGLFTRSKVSDIVFKDLITMMMLMK